MAHNPSEREKNDAFEQGVRDAQAGNYNPPKGDSFVDAIFAPIDLLAGSSSTKDQADSVRSDYNEGYKAGR